MSKGAKFGYGFLLAGVGVPYLMEHLVGQRLAFGAALICTLVGAWLLFSGHTHGRHDLDRLRVIVVVVLIVVALGGAGWRWKSKAQRESEEKPLPSPPNSADRPPTTLGETFRQDFPSLDRYTFNDIEFAPKDGPKIPIESQVYANYLENYKFVGFYIPSTEAIPQHYYDYRASLALVDFVQRAMDDVSKHLRIEEGLPDQQTKYEDLEFSGRVMLYVGDDLSIPQKAEILSRYKAKNFDVFFFGPNHLKEDQDGWLRQHNATAISH